MSIEDTSFDSEKWGDVWNRVMTEGGEAKEPTQKHDETAKLRAFMDAECEAARHLTVISARCCRCIGASLMSIAECDLRHFKALRTRYFILTGERYCPPDACPVIGSVTEALRNIYIAKLQIIAGYDEAAETASDSVVVEMYEQLMEEEECTAEEINCAIMKLLR